MTEILAVLTPDVLVLLAYLIGSLVIGATVIVGMLFLADYFGRWY
jgi:hypothetical protein